MPELPEVEVVRQSLDKKIKQKKVKKVIIRNRNLRFKIPLNFQKYLKNGDKFLINCCTQHITSIYGSKSEQMKDFKSAISRK